MEFLHECPKDDALEIEEMELVPIKMDDSKAEVQDPLLEIDLGTEDNHQPIYINGLIEPELQAKTEELLREFRIASFRITPRCLDWVVTWSTIIYQ